MDKIPYSAYRKRGEMIEARDKRIAELEAQLEKDVQGRWDANREIVRLEDTLREIASMPYATDAWQIADAALKGRGGNEQKD